MVFALINNGCIYKRHCLRISQMITLFATTPADPQLTAFIIIPHIHLHIVIICTGQILKSSLYQVYRITDDTNMYELYEALVFTVCQNLSCVLCVRFS